MVLDRLDMIISGLADDFTAGRFQAAAACCAEPFVLHLEQHLIPVSNQAALIAGLRSYRRLLQDHGVIRVTARVVAEEIPRRNRFRFWVDWHYHGREGRRDYHSHSIFYARNTTEGIALEMAQFTLFAHRSETARLQAEAGLG